MLVLICILTNLLSGAWKEECGKVPIVAYAGQWFASQKLRLNARRMVLGRIASFRFVFTEQKKKVL